MGRSFAPTEYTTLIDTTKYCTCVQEIIAARIQLASGSRKFKTYLSVSAHTAQKPARAQRGP
ncbi:hypothetical protein HPB48_007746 [Haemaphysalis longicornis]|uniref:Uncharacterized protein n=1 Tax=Haemaphysalis longicornis TaxID=44386 RepID=A0A9J6GQQ0_HAELO|nr:hypothetical protein HPB48_007746 [Haemaphysalis longicornis]